MLMRCVKRYKKNTTAYKQKRKRKKNHFGNEGLAWSMDSENAETFWKGKLHGWDSYMIYNNIFNFMFFLLSWHGSSPVTKMPERWSNINCRGNFFSSSLDNNNFRRNRQWFRLRLQRLQHKRPLCSPRIDFCLQLFFHF